LDDLEIIVKFGMVCDLAGIISIKKIKYRDIVYANDFRMICQWAELQDGLYHIIIICNEKNMMFELTYDRFFTWQVLKNDKLNEEDPKRVNITYRPG